MIFSYVSSKNSLIYSEQNPNGIELLSDKLSDIISSYPLAEIFLAGDLNARIKCFCDYIPNDELNFVFGPSISYPADNFKLTRNSKDCNRSNTFGLSLVELCCTHGIHVLNDRLLIDKLGEFTCFANNGTSVLDYMITSKILFIYFMDFGVSDQLFLFIAHCIVSLPLKQFVIGQ